MLEAGCSGTYTAITMHLSATDLQAIRLIIREELKRLNEDTEAFKNDVKEIYFMLAEESDE